MNLRMLSMLLRVTLNTLNDKLQMSHNQWEKNRIEARGMQNFFEEHDENQKKKLDTN